MASFSANLGTIWYWGSQSYPVAATIYGEANRSGNNVVLSNMSLGLSWPSSAYGNWPVDFTVAGSTTSWSPLVINTPSVGLNNAVISAGASDTSASISWSSSDGYSGSFTVTFDPGSNKPSGVNVAWVSDTWNSVTVAGACSNWGTGTNPRKCLVVMDGSSSESSGWLGRLQKWLPSNPTTDYESLTISNETADESLAGGLDIKGMTFYKIGCHCETTEGATAATDWSLRRTPPAPIQNMTITKAETSTGYSVTVKITGGDSTMNNDTNTATFCRISTDNGKSWSLQTVTNQRPWVEQTFTFSVGNVRSVIVQAQQAYYDATTWDSYAHSETMVRTFIVAPVLYGSVEGVSKKVNKLYGSVNGQSKKILKLYGSQNGKSKLIYKG